jgi:predicted TIM-barrel fold metal-dependent hydrolase
MIVDISNSVPTRELFFEHFANMPPVMTGYRRIFGRGVPRITGISDAEVDEAIASGGLAALMRRLADDDAVIERAVANFFAALDRAGVTYSCIHSFDEESSSGEPAVGNDYVAALVARHPKLIGFAGADPLKGKAAVDELERAVVDLKLKALCLRPFVVGRYAHDPLYHPLYAKCVELDIPVWIHTAINWSTERTMEFGRPIYLDHVAAAFPKLKIIAGHGGWPWINEMVAAAWRNDNVYIDISAHRPRFIGQDNTGWEMLRHFGNSAIQDKVLFGSDWLLTGYPIDEVIAELRALPLKETVKEKWLGLNAARLLGLPVPAAS